MGWALLTHPERFKATFRRQLAPLLVDEAAIPVATSQGWQVLIAERDVSPPNVNVNVQSNPIRNADHGDETP